MIAFGIAQGSVGVYRELNVDGVVADSALKSRPERIRFFEDRSINAGRNTAVLSFGIYTIMRAPTTTMLVGDSQRSTTFIVASFFARYSIPNKTPFSDSTVAEIVRKLIQAPRSLIDPN